MFKFFLFAIDPKDRDLIERLVTLLEKEQSYRERVLAVTLVIRGGRLRLKNSVERLAKAVAEQSPE